VAGAAGGLCGAVSPLGRTMGGGWLLEGGGSGGSGSGNGAVRPHPRTGISTQAISNALPANRARLAGTRPDMPVRGTQRRCATCRTTLRAGAAATSS
jgi:hypothetical protein